MKRLLIGLVFLDSQCLRGECPACECTWEDDEGEHSLGTTILCPDCGSPVRLNLHREPEETHVLS